MIIVCTHPLTVPGGPPENFTVEVISSTQIQLTWQPPAREVQNGRIRLFTVSVSEVQTNTTYSHTSENFTLQLESLHPFYEYMCVLLLPLQLDQDHIPHHSQSGHLKMVSAYLSSVDK